MEDMNYKYNKLDSPIDGKAIVNEGTENEFFVQGFQRNNFRTFLYITLCVFTGGIIWLLGYWNPEKRVRFTHSACVLSNSIVVIVVSGDNQNFVHNVLMIEFDTRTTNSIDFNEFVEFEVDILKSGKFRYFEHMFLRYHVSQQGVVKELSGLDKTLSKVDIRCRINKGISKNSTIMTRLLIHGANHIEIPVKSFFVCVLQEAANPFYLFQVFSFVTWGLENYFYYPIILALFTLTSIFVTAYQTQKQMKELKDMVSRPLQVKYLRESKIFEKSSADLVPGDILLVPQEGMDMPCDAILLDGKCVVNESSLTGESFPVSKKPLILNDDTSSNGIYDISQEKFHTIQYGTKVMQTSCHGNQDYVPTLVIRTGFCTLKGRLIRNIIHPKPISFVFYKEAFRFLFFLATLGILGTIYTIIVLYRQGGIKTSDLIIRSVDVITVIVPPALPACLSIGVAFALRKLRGRNIYCIDPQRINMCGSLKLFVFDKTGTITEDTLKLKGVFDQNDGYFVGVKNDEKSDGQDVMIKAMACCHSLNLIHGKIVGNPVDSSMFAFSKWSLHTSEGEFPFVEPPSHNGNCINILKDFPFESTLQRMSVITKESGKHLVTVYMKGSPEMVLSFCKETSVPSNIREFLSEETTMGHRVLAIATKNLDTNFAEGFDLKTLPRSSVEADLDFAGLIIFENPIKPASKETIDTLCEADIRSVMATGDHLNTAVSVARDVDIIRNTQIVYELTIENNQVICVKLENTHHHQQQQLSDYTKKFSPSSDETSRLIQSTGESRFMTMNYCVALSGTVYNEIKRNFPRLLPKVLMSACVYARMSPVDKTLLVEDLMNIGYTVGMCGDGANDCGALKAADAGIALSHSEASVAAPFTSKVFDISCIPWLIREGRAALVTSFSVFKYMALYSFIQFFGILILFAVKSTYSDWEYFYADLILVFVLAVALTQNRTSSKLAKKKPPGRLSHPMIIARILLQLTIILVFQVIAFILAGKLLWYKKPSELGIATDGFYMVSYENYAVVSLSFYQYIWASLVCSTGEPYRVPLYKNPWFVGIFVFDCILTTVVVFSPLKFITTVLKFPTYLPVTLCLGIIGLSLVNLVVLFIVDHVISQVEFVKKLLKRCCRGNKGLRYDYKQFYDELQNDKSWPPKGM